MFFRIYSIVFLRVPVSGKRSVNMSPHLISRRFPSILYWNSFMRYWGLAPSPSEKENSRPLSSDLVLRKITQSMIDCIFFSKDGKTSLGRRKNSAKFFSEIWWDQCSSIQRIEDSSSLMRMFGRYLWIMMPCLSFSLSLDTSIFNSLRELVLMGITLKVVLKGFGESTYTGSLVFERRASRKSIDSTPVSSITAMREPIFTSIKESNTSCPVVIFFICYTIIII